MTRYNDLPCGHCDAGVYALEALLNGLEIFRGTETRKEALAKSPHCKHRPEHICFGCRDFILAVPFPLTETQCAVIQAEASA